MTDPRTPMQRLLTAALADVPTGQTFVEQSDLRAVLIDALPANADLRRFYGVATDAELIAAQAKHVERLQEQIQHLLPPHPAICRPREG